MRDKAWTTFWRKYLTEKAMIAEFERDPSIKHIELDLLNQSWTRK
jgi:hypothetical protein